MAGDSMRFRNPAGHAGLLNSLLALANSLAGFFGSRFDLLAKESKSALVHVMVLVGCLLAAGVLCAFGYVFLVASAIVGAAHALRISWIWVALAAALIHFILALGCVLIARSRMTKAVFPLSTVEFKKDREWLKNLDKTNLSSK